LKTHRAAAVPPPSMRTHTFTCSSELLRAFERRTYELGCTFDWLLEEAMQRLLAEAGEERRSAPPESMHRAIRPRTTPPLPLPPDATPKSVPPPPTRAQLQALTPPPPPPDVEQRSRSVIRADLPLVLACEGGGEHVVWQYPCVIGRSASTADLVVESAAVSRRHAVIELTGSGWIISDLGSTNGIIVNGHVVRHAALRAGVMFSVGPMTFVVTSP
jgi:FHA domain